MTGGPQLMTQLGPKCSGYTSIRYAVRRKCGSGRRAPLPCRVHSTLDNNISPGFCESIPKAPEEARQAEMPERNTTNPVFTILYI